MGMNIDIREHRGEVGLECGIIFLCFRGFYFLSSQAHNILATALCSVIFDGHLVYNVDNIFKHKRYQIASILSTQWNNIRSNI